MRLLVLLGLFSVCRAQFGLGGVNPFNTAAKLTPSYVNPSNINVNSATGVIKGAVNTAKTAANAVLDAAFGDFKNVFNKTYKSLEEEIHRKEIFIANRAKILSFNENFVNLGKSSFVQKLNGFADMLSHEFNEALNGFNKHHTAKKPQKASRFIPSANVHFPTQVDWRETGAVTPVKSQELCAACWAFAAAGAIEGHNFRKTGKLVELSPQNLIDCTKTYGNDGCEGGLTNPAYDYVKDNHGINTLDAYPFEAKTKECRFKKENVGGNDSGFVFIDEGDEAGLEAAVATIGPVSVAIDASQESFQFYSEGVYYDPKCKSDVDHLNHAVLVVGFGQEPDGKKYWLVKNSYGPKWGLGGYIKMAKGRNNHCGIATFASYPLV